MNLVEELESHGVEAVTQFVRGHRANAAARGFWPVSSDPVVEVRDAAVLESHAIVPDAIHALRNSSVELFLQRRGDVIKRLTYSFLDSRLEPGALTRPSLKDLTLAGAAEDEAE